MFLYLGGKQFGLGLEFAIGAFDLHQLRMADDFVLPSQQRHELQCQQMVEPAKPFWLLNPLHSKLECQPQFGRIEKPKCESPSRAGLGHHSEFATSVSTSVLSLVTDVSTIARAVYMYWWSSSSVMYLAPPHPNVPRTAHPNVPTG